MYLKSLMIVAVAFLLPNNMLAQSRLSGKVTGHNHVQLAGVIVQVENTLIAAVTNADGTYEINKLTPGNYRIKLSLLGHETVLETVDVQGSLVKDFMMTKKNYLTDEVIISATRLGDHSVSAYQTLLKADLEKNNTGKDVPVLLDLLPGVVTTSDAGAGIGYTGIRIRGSDATRINVTINGIPINDAESQGMYWVDMPDLISSVDELQVQPGVGTSTNGAAAFGGSINLLTDKLQPNAYGEASASYGSFNTQRATFKAGTGLLKNRFSLETRLSKIKSDGYIDRATSDLSSVMVSAGYYGKKSLVKFVLFSGKEITYQSWNGTPESRVNNDVAAMQDYITRNGLDEQDASNLLNAGRTYNFYTYNNQVDNFRQDNYQLHFSHELNSSFSLNVALHMTRGIGYYEEFKKQASLSSYGLEEVTIGTVVISETDLVRRKWLDNYFYGTTYSLNYKTKRAQTIFGGGSNRYDGDHYGRVIWAQYASNGKTDHQYYFNNGLKTDVNFFLKHTYDLSGKWNLWADAQVRSINYKFEGFDDNLTSVPQKQNYTFFNPKAGVSFKRKPNEAAYLSVSVGTKEPSRDDFTDSSPLSRPKAERMIDVEAGYKMTWKKVRTSLNLYHMQYDNQLVLSGKVNDVGNYTRTNIKNSYRQGIEFEMAAVLSKKIKLSGNVALSENKIKDYNYFLDAYDINFNYEGQQTTLFKNTDIAFSPRTVASAKATYSPLTGLEFSWSTKYVGKQFLDNTSNDNKSISAFTYSNLSAHYAFAIEGLREITVGATVYNLFNAFYESNGYTYGYSYDNQVVNENFYYPQAGINFMGQVAFKF